MNGMNHIRAKVDECSVWSRETIPITLINSDSIDSYFFFFAYKLLYANGMSERRYIRRALVHAYLRIFRIIDVCMTFASNIYLLQMPRRRLVSILLNHINPMALNVACA